jgi:DNA-binding MarR family transcriptional regulator
MGARMSDAESNGLPRQSSLGYQVNHLARLLALALRRRIEALGVVPGQFAQLLALYEQDGLTQSELSRRVRIEQPTMAVTLKRMERDGLVERVPDPSDGRRALVMLTAQARRLEPDLTAAAREVNAIAVEGLTAAEADGFMRTLDRLIANLEAERPTRDRPEPAISG